MTPKWYTILALMALLIVLGVASSKPQQCTSDADCGSDYTCSLGKCVPEGGSCPSDDNPCTLDRRVRGQCVNIPLIGISCDDGNSCTEKDTCIVGTCKGKPISCESGYTCEDGSCSDIDECTTLNPCQNGGECANADGSYTCYCASGFTGTNCETKDPCDPNPCDENEACIIDEGSSGGYHCQSIPPDPCTSNPCKNGGTCTPDYSDLYTCECLNGYYGDNCEKDACWASECPTHSTCVANELVVGDYTCVCDPGWAGPYCNWDTTDPCYQNADCGDYGTCEIVDASEGTYSCTCTSGYTGDDCSIPPSPPEYP